MIENKLRKIKLNAYDESFLSLLYAYKNFKSDINYIREISDTHNNLGMEYFNILLNDIDKIKNQYYKLEK